MAASASARRARPCAPGLAFTSPAWSATPFVRYFNGVFHMWTMFGTGWKQFPGESAPDRIYPRSGATSPDGIHWSKDEGRALVPDRLGPDECQALPSVIRVDNRYLMVFCYRGPMVFATIHRAAIGSARPGPTISSTGPAPTTCRASSARLVPGTPTWVCYPHLSEIDSRIVPALQQQCLWPRRLWRCGAGAVGIAFWPLTRPMLQLLWPICRPPTRTSCPH